MRPWMPTRFPPMTAEEVEVYYRSSNRVGLAYYLGGSWHFHFGTSFPDFWRPKAAPPI